MTTSLFQFRPSHALAPSTEYVVTVDSDLQDTLGAFQPAPYSWSFTTEYPRVLRVEPSNPRRHIAAAGPLALRFNQPMNRASTEAAFALTGPEGEVPGRFVWENEDALLQFVPSTPLVREAEYTLSVAAGARGAAGGETRESFTTTVIAAPLLSPTLINPSAGATGVEPYAGISINLNTPLDPALFPPFQPIPNSSRYVSLEPEPEGLLSLSYDTEQLILHAYVEGGLKPSTTYTVTVDNLRDESGQQLAEPYSWQFTTGTLPPLLYLASQNAGQLGTYSPYTPTLQVVNYQSLSRLDFSLFRLSETELFNFIGGSDQYRNWESYTGDPAKLVAEWSVTPEGGDSETEQLVTQLPPDGELEPGLYFFRVTAPERRPYDGLPLEAKQIFALTSVNLTVKRTDQEVLVWAVDLQSGAAGGGRARAPLSGSRQQRLLQRVMSTIAACPYGYCHSGGRDRCRRSVPSAADRRRSYRDLQWSLRGQL